MNTRVDFKLAKLLKKKNWDINTYSDCWVKTLDGKIIHNKERKSCAEHDRCEQYLMQPTIAEVVMWLYKKHSLWTIIIPTVTGNFAYKVIDVQLNPEKIIERPPYKDVSAEDFSEPTDAYLGAIEDILNNLI